MRRENRELWLAFAAVLLITLLYLYMAIRLGSVPAASEFFGHSLGVLGFILMLMTETLYTFRKRSRRARWGRMASWLKFHIFTGIVGPYMVLLHSSWKFNGVAGLVMLLTIVVVVSGFVGRYIYTAVPRTADGVVIEARELEQQIRHTETELQGWLAARPGAARALSRPLAMLMATPQGGISLFFGRGVQEWVIRLRWWREKQRLRGIARAQVDQLERLLRRQRTLQRQLASLALARRLLALWHAVHIPIGMALFASAFVHILGAIYYATLLR
jgi:putative flippase GtrA